MTIDVERITPDAYVYVETMFDDWCDKARIPHRPWGAAAEDDGTREWLREGDTWQRNRADRIVRFGKATTLLVDIKTTTPRNGGTGNVAIEIRTLWAAEMEHPKDHLRDPARGPMVVPDTV